MKIYSFSVIIIIVLSIFFSASVTGSWPSIQNNSSNTGCSEYALKENYTIEWGFETGNDIFNSYVIDEQGNVYCVSEDHFIYSISPNGSLNWKYDTGVKWCSTPLLLEDQIIISAGDIISLSYNGVSLWTYDMEGYGANIPPVENIDGSIIIVDGHDLISLDKNGHMNWIQEMSISEKWNIPVVDPKGNIYFGGQYKLFSYTVNGEERWNISLDYNEVSNIIAYHNGNIILGNSDKLYSISQNGTIKWRFESDGAIGGGPTIDIMNDYIYFATESGSIFSLDFDGKFRWKKEIQIMIHNTVIVDSNGLIFAPEVHGIFSILTSGGEIKESIQVPGTFFAHAAIGENGEIYVGSLNNTLYKLSQDKSSIEEPKENNDPILNDTEKSVNISIFLLIIPISLFVLVSLIIVYIFIRKKSRKED